MPVCAICSFFFLFFSFFLCVGGSCICFVLFFRPVRRCWTPPRLGRIALHECHNVIRSIMPFFFFLMLVVWTSARFCCCYIHTREVNMAPFCQIIRSILTMLFELRAAPTTITMVLDPNSKSDYYVWCCAASCVDAAIYLHACIRGFEYPASAN